MFKELSLPLAEPAEAEPVAPAYKTVLKHVYSNRKNKKTK